MHRRPALARPCLTVVGLAVCSLALSACSPASGTGELSSPALAPAPTASAVPVDASPTPVAPAAPSPSPSATASEPAASPTAAPSRKPSFTYDVAGAQRVLQAGGYYAGSADGRGGPALRSAVMAFQKVNGLGADGTVGPATLAALASPRTPVLKGSSPSDRVEVDLTRQVLYVVKGGRIARIMPVSSGNGATYSQKDGGTARALTPVGHYRIQRRIVGERVADLGTLYDPQYFYGGWAIHGSNSVPARPASHGCVRVTRADAKALLGLLRNGMDVHLYGGTHTFTAGSSAPGTSNPTGDTAGGTTDRRPTPTPTRAPSPAAPSPKPSPKTSPKASPTPTPTAASSPRPVTTPRPASPSASPAR